LIKAKTEIRARTTFVESFFYFEKKALLRSAGQPYCSDSHTAQKSTSPASKFNISTTMAKKTRRVNENRLQEALNDYLNDGNKLIT